MESMTFDSLRYARRLKTAGVPEPQAEAHAEAMAEAFGFFCPQHRDPGVPGCDA